MNYSQQLHISQIYHYHNSYDLETPIAQKYQRTLIRFRKRFQSQPTHFVKCPAVLKLFGTQQTEFQLGHVFFNLEQDLICAFKADQKYDKINIHSVLSIKNPDITLELDPFDNKYREQDEYYNLCLQGYKAALRNLGLTKFMGFNLFISNHFNNLDNFNLKQSLSLSLAIITLYANKLHSKINSQQLYLNLLTEMKRFNNNIKQLTVSYYSLHYLGNKQIGILNWQKDKDTYQISKCQTFKQYSFVIANSLAPEPLKTTVGKRYNLRKCENILALGILSKHLGMSINKWSSLSKQALIGEIQKNLDFEIEDIKNLVEQSMQKKNYSAEQIQALLEQDIEKYLSHVPYCNQVLKFNNTFNPYRFMCLTSKIMFLIKEQEQVQSFRKIMLSEQQEQKKIEKIRLLFAENCKNVKQLLEIQIQEINQLVSIAKDFGCHIYKHIGYGYGGSILFLVRKTLAQSFISTLNNKFYQSESKKILLTDQIEQLAFSSYPTKGISLLDPQYQIWY